MHRRTALAALGASLLPLAGCGGDGDTTTPSPRLHNPSFESGLDGWTVGRDLPDDPSGGPVDSEVTTTAARAADGERALSLFVDGRQDDGTLWVQQSAALSGVETLAVAAYAESESFNTLAKLAVYAGPDPGRPLTEADFDTSRPTEDHAGWKTYEYSVAHDGPGLVAVGISVVWEAELTRLLDDVRLTDV